MNNKEFSQIRHHLGKTQIQMALLLGISSKAIQSFEQGWRKIPAYIGRQSLFLLAMKRSARKGNKPCWVVRRCPMATRRKYPAWEFQSRNLCWFINGTVCQGEVQESWHKKMKTCRKCEVFRPLLALL